MQTPQEGIFTRLSENHYFLEYKLRGGAQPEQAKPVLRGISGLGGKGGPSSVMGFGSRLWKKLSPSAVPKGLRPFTAIKGRGGKSAPATQQDLWLWIHGKHAGELFDLAMQAHNLLGPWAKLAVEVSGVTYRGGRDLTGFVDGTANPRGAEAKRVALIPEGEAGAGGSIALTMRWVHNLAAFHALPVSEQEAVIGRTKVKDAELQGAARKPSGHISRMEIELDGEELQIYRRSTPYGTVQEHGLYFLAFAREPTPFTAMLKSMFGLAEDRIEDRLTDYSRPVTGSFYFVPSQESLREMLG